MQEEIIQLIEEFLKAARRPLIVILGPTSAGKTQLSLDLASRFSGEIISADSRQVYRHMDIGTDKIPIEKRKNIPHHLIDVVNPDERFTVADYKRMTEKTIDEILEKSHTPFLVGGSGLYIRAVTQNFTLLPESKDLELRKKLTNELETEGKQKLHEKLMKLDPESAKKIHPNNIPYLLRALEIVLLTGKPKSVALQQKEDSQTHHEATRYDILKIGLNLPRETLYRRIEDRVDAQIKNGLVEETKKLLENYLPHFTSMRTLGYQEIALYLQNKISLETAIALIKQHTRHFAKRQMTWWRQEADIHWFTLLQSPS